MPMKVKNGTRYSGVMLRSVFLAVVNHVEEALGHETPLAAQQRAAFIRVRCSVEYTYTRGPYGCSGRASLQGGWCRLCLARNDVKLADLIWLVQHEVWHLFGVGHRDMPDAVNNRSNAATAAVEEHFADLISKYGTWVHEEPVKVATKPSTEEKQTAKLASIEERISRWESKRKRAENALKKLQKQRRYYEGQLATAAKEKSS